ncbi:hypothetical protein CISG_05731 [Coccidioides immitis RMSCC 3703]|uniref:non-specific serine/threonine protein kinase n=1 Tax=Coccidioides immitis RMSCC 3703 TaxID=454286 RepID=A0A0J8QYZ8_COCIT|nr:hypothetical protein CISG_05731 [Coccidioides immitis RMSCC 3703]
MASRAQPEKNRGSNPLPLNLSGTVYSGFIRVPWFFVPTEYRHLFPASYLRDVLQEAEKIYESRLSCDGSEDSLDQLYRNAIQNSLCFTGEMQLQLARDENFKYDDYRARGCLVTQRPPGIEIQDVDEWNIDIWKAVFSLIDTVPRTTPPASVPPSFDGTPIRSTSSSQKGSEQTRELVNPRIFEEIRGCTFRDVEGFFDKYFEGKNWSGKADAICRRVLAPDSDGNWAQFPNPPTQDDVLAWWFRLQEDLLSESRGTYYTTASKVDLTGSKAERQVDLLLRARSGSPSRNKHDWRDILVVGELKKPKEEIRTKSTLLQMGCCVREVFAAQPTRRFVHAFAVCGTKMEAYPSKIIFQETQISRTRGCSRRTSRASSTENGEEPYDNRVLRCLLISPAGRPIYKYESPLELLKALRDAIKAHRSLYLDGNILHRDISENNIIITDPEKAGGHSGMLIDLDLAKEVGSERSGARHQTGTMEFMAIEVLLNIDHTYRHDLESFFYVLIWQCARNGWGKDNHPKDSKLRAWYTGNYEDIANAKLGHMSKAENMGFGFILREFPPKFRGVVPLCRVLRDILFPYNDKGLIVGTPQDPNRLYDPIIKAYDDTITQFELGNLTHNKSI